MKNIGVISDTHGSVHKGVKKFLLSCDEVWHAGDIGNVATFEEWRSFKPLLAVYGNIDDYLVRHLAPKIQCFTCEECKVFITHIGGYPGRYAPGIEALLKEYEPDIMISGHSHILKVMHDNKHNLMYMNPGAAGESGFHKTITALRFKIDGKKMKDLEVLDIDRSL